MDSLAGGSVGGARSAPPADPRQRLLVENLCPDGTAIPGEPGAVTSGNGKEMKTTELKKLLWRAVNESDTLPLSEAEERLYTAIQMAVMAYEDEVRVGHPGSERRCMICEKPLSECYC